LNSSLLRAAIRILNFRETTFKHEKHEEQEEEATCSIYFFSCESFAQHRLPIFRIGRIAQHLLPIFRSGRIADYHSALGGIQIIQLLSL